MTTNEKLVIESEKQSAVIDFYNKVIVALKEHQKTLDMEAEKSKGNSQLHMIILSKSIGASEAQQIMIDEQIKWLQEFNENFDKILREG